MENRGSMWWEWGEDQHVRKTDSSGDLHVRSSFYVCFVFNKKPEVDFINKIKYTLIQFWRLKVQDEASVK